VILRGRLALEVVNEVHKAMLSCRQLGVAIGLLALVALGLGGCGVRGPLDTPPEAKTSDSAPRAPGQPPPHKPSVLDPLIR
jgi:predicted small lipoprotein YifL